jgi:hypothetical protein
MTDDISGYFEKAMGQLKSEHDSMLQKIKEEVEASKRKVLSKV